MGVGVAKTVLGRDQLNLQLRAKAPNLGVASLFAIILAIGSSRMHEGSIN